MAFLEFRIGRNNYELRDVTYCQFGILKASKIYSLILKDNPKYDCEVGRLYGDICKSPSLNTSKKIFVKAMEEYATVKDEIAMEYALQYLNNEE